MNNKVFVYGTLSFPEIISSLLGRTTHGKLAKVSGYNRIRVKNKAYPGLVAADREVEGVYHDDITDDELKLLDTFEDDFYTRQEVTVGLMDGITTTATTYVITKENLSFATDKVWDRDNFAKSQLANYKEMVTKYRKDYLDGHNSAQVF